MASLQVYNLSSIKSIHSNEQNDDLVVIAHHRRSSSLLSISAPSSSDPYGAIEVSRQVKNKLKYGSAESKLEWTCMGKWSIPQEHSTTSTEPIIAAVAIEIFDVFLIVTSGSTRTTLIYIDLFGTIVAAYELAQVNGVKCIDFDQNRKELITGLKGGHVMSFALRLVQKFGSKKNNDKKWGFGGGQFQALLRKHIQLPKELGRYIKQLVTQDVTGSCLLLTKTGIICLDSSSLEVIWNISENKFLVQPIKIWCDKFGSSFVAYCKEDIPDGKEVLEYWSPPSNYNLCHDGNFGRTVVPLSGRLLLVTLESIGNGLGLLIIIITDNRLVQLWRPTEDQRIKLESEVTLFGDVGAFDRSTIKDTKLHGIQGLTNFTGNPGISDCPVLLLATCHRQICTIAMHTPGDEDAHYHREMLNVLIQQHMGHQNIQNESANNLLNTFSRPIVDRIVQHEKQHRTLVDIISRGKSPDFINDETNRNNENFNQILEFDDESRPQTKDLATQLELSANNSIELTEYPQPVQDIISVSKKKKNFNEIDDSLQLNIITESEPIAPDELDEKSIKEFFDHIEGQQEQRRTRDRYLEELSVASGTSFDGSMNDDIYSNAHFSTAFNPEKPIVQAFFPMSLISSKVIEELSKSALPLKQKITDNNLLRIISPLSATMAVLPSYSIQNLKDPSKGEVVPIDKKYNEKQLLSSSIQFFSRKGLLDPDYFLDSKGNSSIEFKLIGFAFRAGMIGVITNLKEGYVYSQPTKTTKSAFVRLELNMRQNAVATAIMVADVLLTLPPETTGSLKKAIGSTQEICGIHALSFFGDSDGKVNFALSSGSVAMQNGAFKAHSSPIIAILATGDTVKPLWRLGAEEISKDGQLGPRAVPGSGIVTVARDGEVKVWQPVFKCQDKARARKELILNIFNIEWRMSSIFTVRSIARPLVPSDGSIIDFSRPSKSNFQPVTSAYLDPSCLTLIVAFEDGFMNQWSIPGLVDCGQGSLSTCQDSIWTTKKHLASITSIRIWYDADDTSILEVTPKQQLIDKKGTKPTLGTLNKEIVYVSIVNGPQKTTIAYTYQQLKRIADNSSMTTSSADYTVILWKYEIEEARSGKSSCFLKPQPCRRFTFSNDPVAAICFTPTTIDSRKSNIWNLSVIVKGIVITAAKAVREELFVDDNMNHNVDEFVPKTDIGIIMTDDVSSKHPDGNDDLLSVQSHHETEAGLYLLPVICNIKKPLHAAEVMSKKLPINIGYSWNALTVWSDQGETYNSSIVTYDDISKEIVRPVTVSNVIPGGIFEKDSLHVEDDNKGDVTKMIYNGVKLSIPTVKMEEIIDEMKKDPTKRHCIESEPFEIPSTPFNAITDTITDLDGGKLVEDPAVSSLYTAPIGMAHDSISLAYNQSIGTIGDIVKTLRNDLDPQDLKRTVSLDMTHNFSVEISKSVASIDSIDSNLVPIRAVEDSPYLSKEMMKHIRAHASKAVIMPSLGSQDGLAGTPVKGERSISPLKDMDAKFTDSPDVSPKKQIFANEPQKCVMEDGTVRDIQVKMTKFQLLKQQKALEIISKRMMESKKNKVFYQSKPNAAKRILKEGANAVKQINGNSSIFAPPPGIKTAKSKEKFVLPKPTPELTEESKVDDSIELVPIEDDKVVVDNIHSHKEIKTRAVDITANALPPPTSTTEPHGAVYFKFSDPSIIYQKTKQQKMLGIELFRTLSIASDDDASSYMSSEALSLLSSAGLSQEELDELKDLILSLGLDAKKNFDTLTMEEKRKLFEDLTSAMLMMDEDDEYPVVTEGIVGETIEGNTLLEGKSETFLKLRKKFMVILKIKIQENLKRMHSPKLNILSCSPTHNAVNLSIASASHGIVTIIVIPYDIDKNAINASDFDSKQNLRSKFPNSKITEIQYDGEDEPKDVEVIRLKPELRYRCYAYIIKPKPVEEDQFHYLMLDEFFQETLTEFETIEEPLEIEWSKLSSEMRIIEIKAATRSVQVQELFKLDKDAPKFPSDEDLLELPTLTAGSNKPSEKRLNDFIAYWTGNDPKNGFGNTRCQFLFAEAAYAAKDLNVRQMYFDQGFTNETDILKLAEMAESITKPDPTDDYEGPLDNLIFKKFRSWYKAGQVVDNLLDELDQAAEKANELTRIQDEKKALEKKGQDEFGEKDVLSNSEILISDSITVEPTNIPVIVNEGSLAEGSLVEGSTQLDGLSSSFYESSVSVVETIDYVGLILDQRCKLLTARIEAVNECIDLCKQLSEAHVESEKLNLCEADLIERRTELKEKDIKLIMSSLKLLDLCVEKSLTTRGRGLESHKLGKGVFTYQNISSSDLFGICNPHILVPDDPPSVEAAYLPGTKRRPLKAWQLMQDNEKTLELALACTLDEILELAVVDGISMPEPEDASLDPKLFPSRANRWKAFSVWYCGDEGVKKVPGQGIPTLARVLFAENWEMLSIDNDPWVEVQMNELDLIMAISSSASVASHASHESNGNQNVDRDASEGEEKVKSHLLISYSASMAKANGVKIRTELIRRNIDAIMRSRRLSMLQWFAPPGAARIGNQFMFPKIGLMLPNLEMPEKRYKLFPSVSMDSYNKTEILSWYTIEELDDDDKKMIKAEAYGVKLRAYLEWLSHEDERRVESRLMMLDEDRQGRISRIYWKEIDEKMKEKPQPVPIAYNYALIPEIGNFDHILSLNRFEDGSGVDNEDELEDIKEAQNLAALKAIEDEKRYKQEIEDERRRREEEELARIRREESDRRLAENAERRRKLREHLDHLVASRAMQKAETERILQEKTKLEGLKAAKQAEAARILASETAIENRRLGEINKMEKEELYTKDINSRVIEIRIMEHEDIMSIMREKYDDEIQLFKEKRLRYLAEIYEPFEPYKFKKESIRLPELHSLLSESNLNDDQYEIVNEDFYYNEDKSSELLYVDDFLSQYENEKPEYNDTFNQPFEEMVNAFKPTSTPARKKKKSTTPLWKLQSGQKSKPKTPSAPGSPLKETITQININSNRNMRPKTADTSVDNRANYEWYTLQGASQGTKGAFMYGPKSMQQKNANSDISTNSIRLEPLDVTSIHLMKSLNRVNSAPASLNNDMSMESIDYQQFFQNNQNNDYNDNVFIEENANDDNDYYNNDNYYDNDYSDYNDVPNGINFSKIREELRRFVNVSTTEASLSSLPTLAELDKFKFLETQKKLALASLSSLHVADKKKGKKKSKRNLHYTDDFSIATDNHDSSVNYTVNTPVDDNGKHRLDLVPLIKDANNLVRKVKDDRDLVVQYLESKPIYMGDDDDYFLQACQANPDKRTTKRHIIEFQETIAKFQELEGISNMSDLSESLMYGSSSVEVNRNTKRKPKIKNKSVSAWNNKLRELDDPPPFHRDVFGVRGKIAEIRPKNATGPIILDKIESSVLATSNTNDDVEKSNKLVKAASLDNIKLKRPPSKVMKIPLRYNMNSNSQELAVNGSGSILELSQISKSDEKSVASKLELGPFNEDDNVSIRSHDTNFTANTGTDNSSFKRTAISKISINSTSKNKQRTDN